MSREGSRQHAHAMPPLRADFLPFHRPTIGEDEIQGVVEVLRSGWLTTGPKVQELERALKDRLGCGGVVAVNSCTAALHLALVAAAVGDGDEVITTPYTFASTGETILYTGALPVFVDVEASTANLDPDRIEAAITPRTRAISPVHMAGHPCRMEPILEIARRRGLAVIEDAAHAFGTSYRGRAIGSLSRFTAFSFYATKNLTTGEGGLLACADADDAARARKLSLHGLSRDAWRRYAAGGSWAYAIEDLGYKYNLTDVAAAIGLAQLRRFDEEQAKRRERVDWYREALSGSDAFEVPADPEDGEHAWHLFILRLRPGTLSIDRDEFARRLQEARIGISVHFIPLHLHPLYQDRLGLRPGDLPVAEDLYSRAISLPLFPGMSKADVEYVAAAAHGIAAACRA